MLEVLATHRYEDITIMELCSWLDIPRKEFYRYFSSKEGAILLATDEEIFPRNLFLDHSRATREQVALFVVSGMMTMVAQWHQNRFSHSPQKMADIAAHLLTQPLVSAPVEPGTAEG